MVTTKQQALDIAAKIKIGLKEIYGPRLRGVYLYGSAARDNLTPDSDIDIAVVLDKISDRYIEHQRISKLGAEISLENDTVVLFILFSEDDYETGRFEIHKAIAHEGIPA